MVMWCEIVTKAHMDESLRYGQLECMAEDRFVKRIHCGTAEGTRR